MKRFVEDIEVRSLRNTLCNAQRGEAGQNFDGSSAKRCCSFAALKNERELAGLDRSMTHAEDRGGF